ncbi:MAG: PIG-L family deacetylase [Candidatus Hydrogenedentes bacterium]|jgi:LmbE family N-acetylglucosaminyl deacetylase|nr:PIG-L family deacetylase [Candidatus Hydrogenedentota bacterium]
MRFTVSSAEAFVPDGTTLDSAAVRTTHLAVGAHQDDLEIMAFDGILNCFQRKDQWFSAVVVTDGKGSPRTGLYASLSDDEMAVIRREEQKKAAIIGDYSVQFLLNHPSSAVKDGENSAVVDDLYTILDAARPEKIYTHNPADKHDTHIGVLLKLIAAIRRMPKEIRPKELYGCEVWRDLDWLHDPDKVVFDLSGHENLQAALLGVFDSQVSGGKRYDLATLGRRRAHATFFASHNVDAATAVSFAMNLTPLLEDDSLTAEQLFQRYLQRFAEEVGNRMKALGQ